jgi:arginine decarboxylase
LKKFRAQFYLADKIREILTGSAMKDWDIQQAGRLYNIGQWDEGYAEILENGHLALKPGGEASTAIDLMQLMNDVRASGLQLPVLVRFLDILQHRVQSLHHAFDSAISDHAYRGTYTPVYPIKVNQQQPVVEEILSAGGARVGLEAGSKAELMAVLASLQDKRQVVVCNGYKDRHYIRRALIGQLLGHRVYIVVEKLSEVRLLVEEASRMGIQPTFGLRVRLASVGMGNWQNSGGEKSKFGLSSEQSMEVIGYLQEIGMLSCLKLLHVHMGSQIADIEAIRRGATEAVRFYCEFVRHGAALEVLNVGGGLGVDYESTSSRGTYSVNYDLLRYASTIVETVASVCDGVGVAHPNLITECGRAMTAHHAVLVCNVIEAEMVDETEMVKSITQTADTQRLCAVLERVRAAEAVGHNEADEIMRLLQIAFVEGRLSMEQRAFADHCYRQIRRAQQQLEGDKAFAADKHMPLVDKYFCNFSVFQSLPDVWGLDQVFPILPLHRLDERPSREAVLQDLTCDSDGHIEFYPCGGEIRSSLPLHALKADEEYLLGFFLVGAYQEILGDMHNLFGDSHVVNVKLDAKGGYQLTGTERGDCTRELLEYVHYDTGHLLEDLEQRLRDNIQDTTLLDECRRELKAGLEGYSYHEK